MKGSERERQIKMWVDEKYTQNKPLETSSFIPRCLRKSFWHQCNFFCCSLTPTPYTTHLLFKKSRNLHNSTCCFHISSWKPLLFLFRLYRHLYNHDWLFEKKIKNTKKLIRVTWVAIQLLKHGTLTGYTPCQYSEKSDCQTHDQMIF